MKRWLLLLVLVCVAACTGGGKGVAVSAPTDRPLSAHASAPTGRADAAVETLFARLTIPKNANEGARAAAEAFAWAGMATHALKGVTQEAAPPIAPIVTPDFVTYRAAQDYAQGPVAPRLSLDKLGEWLQRLGWKPKNHPPAQALALVLYELVKAARARPESADSFVPLFLERSLKAGGDVDVAKPDVPASEISLSLLDLRLFLGAHLRGMKVEAAQKKAAEILPPPSSRLAKMSLDGPTAGGGTSLPTICSDFLDWMGAAGVLRSGVMDLATNSGVGALYDRLGVGSGAGTAIYWLLRGLDLVLSTHNNNLSFTLHGAPATTHKSSPEGNPREAHFTARVQMMEFTSEVEQMARDCAEKMGFDIDTGGRNMAQWRVYWGEGAEFSELATIPDRNNFNYAQPMPGHNLHVERVNPTTKVGTANLVVDIAKEEEHRPGAPIESRQAWVRAELNQAAAPGLESLFGSLQTGAAGLSPGALAGELLFVAEGLRAEFNPEVARAFVSVDSCKSDAQEWTGTIRYRRALNSIANNPGTTDVNGRTTSGTITETSTETATVRVDGSKAAADFESKATLDVTKHDSFMQQCEFRGHVFQKKIEINGWAKQASSVSAAAKVKAEIAVSPDGRYVVSFATPASLLGTFTVSSSETQIQCQGSVTNPGPSINETKHPIAGFSGRGTGTYSGTGGITGQYDKSTPYLAGTITEHMEWSFQPKAR